MKTGKTSTILPTPNGPYVVKEVDTLTNRNGALEARATMALCRCGGSANKPFCDGTHTRNRFSSAKSDDRVPDQRDDYAGTTVTIHDNRGICAHAGRCTDGLPSVFRLHREPWIDPHGASADQIVETVRACPSGALSYTVDAVAPQDPERPAAIHVSPNGPYLVSGGPELLETARGQGASTEHYTLCRCGGSKNKPFCDGSHWYNNFSDERN